MPELKPCPHCGGMNAVPMLDEDGEYFVMCYACGMSGPTTKYMLTAITAWNALPRRPDYNDVDCAGCPERRRSALTWTTDPPRVAGWYWCRASTLNMPRCVEVYGAWEQLMFGSKRDDFNPQMPVTREGFEWAGPIPTPHEPEES
jgi:Lar family restriction alleviation protein